MTRRYFSNTAILSYITSSLNGVDTTSTFSVSATSGGATAPPTDWPSVPFYAAINRGAADEEVVLVTDVTGSSVTVTRGSTLDSPYGSTTQAHSINATIEHVAAAADFDEANGHIEATTGHGATGAVVGTTNSQTLTNKTLTAPTITTPTISGTGFTNATHAHAGASSGGTIDHGALTGLSDDDHPQYQKESEKSAANGYASLDASTLVPIAELPTGTGATEVALGNHSHTPSVEELDLAQEAASLTGQHLTAGSPGPKTLGLVTIAQDTGKYLILASCLGVNTDSAGTKFRAVFLLDATVGTIATAPVQCQTDTVSYDNPATVFGFYDSTGAGASSDIRFRATQDSNAGNTSATGQVLAIRVA